MTAKNRILVTGGTGKTGRRVVERLKSHDDVAVRVGSRSAQIPFDWVDKTTWQPALTDIDAVYIAFQPDLAIPHAPNIIREFSALAVKNGVRNLVLLSGRGEDEAQHCEEIVQNAGVAWTILRASWFSQNFSENFLCDDILAGAVYLPAGDVQEPFIDVDDIADVAVASLTDDKHAGQLYELTGPRLMTFADAVSEIAIATGRPISFTSISPEAYVAALEKAQLPSDVIWLVNYLFTTVLDGRNACLTDGVQRALGRSPRDFSDYVRDTVATGVWNV
jgi:uncharacterized protein YbjT (DUF2867 family)